MLILYDETLQNSLRLLCNHSPTIRTKVQSQEFSSRSMSVYMRCDPRPRLRHIHVHMRRNEAHAWRVSRGGWRWLIITITTAEDYYQQPNYYGVLLRLLLLTDYHDDYYYDYDGNHYYYYYYYYY